MITIFSTVKPDDDYRQNNAIKSWVALPRSKVLLIGKEAKRLACEFETDFASGVRRSPYGIPLLDSLFEIAQRDRDSNLFLYINADIIVWEDIIVALEICDEEFEEFLMVGQRTNLTVEKGCSLCQQDAKAGSLLHPCGCDFFGFTYNLWPTVLPYVIGRTTFDNWLIWSALEMGKPVIDITKIVTVVHQKHYEDRSIRQSPDAKRNQGLVPLVGGGYVGWVSHSTYVMDSNMEIRKRGA